MVLTDFQATVLAYGIVMIFTFVLVNGLMQWFPIKYLLVKASRGKKILVRIHTKIQPYYRQGVIDKDGFLIFREKLFNKMTDKRIELPDGSLKQELGIFIVDIDQQGRVAVRKSVTAHGQYEFNGLAKEYDVVVHNWGVVRGFDAEHINHFFIREAEKPNLEASRENIKLLLAILTLLGCIVAIFLIVKLTQKADLIIAGQNALRESMKSIFNMTSPVPL